jgi:NAD-dependent deacetylase
VTNRELRTVARQISDGEDVLLHTGPGLLAGTDLPVGDLADAVWGENSRFTRDRLESDPEAVRADWLEFWADAAVDPASVTPRPVHRRVAELVEAGHVSTVITENVFGLLREAGVPADRCIEFHGRVDEAACVRCERTYDTAPGDATGNRRCPACGGTLGPGIVLPSEPPARANRLRAWTSAEDCDVYVGAGTRLPVYPTAENAERALETGTDLLVVGDRPTALDDEATHRLRADPAGALGRLRDALAILG